jgi:hypothetical protein
VLASHIAIQMRVRQLLAAPQQSPPSNPSTAKRVGGITSLIANAAPRRSIWYY